MRSTADIIYHLLLQLGHITTSGDWTGYVAFFPDMPDEAVCIVDTSGLKDGRLMKTGETIEHPGFTVRIRGKDYTEAWAKSNSIAEELDTICPSVVEILPGEIYTLVNVSRVGTVLALGTEERDEGRRHQFTINAVVTLRQT